MDMKDVANMEFNTNPNLEAFNRKVMEMGIDQDSDSAIINFDQLNRAYIEGREPEINKIIRDNAL